MKYESINGEPQVGDYVICNEVSASKTSIKFTSENIGQIVGITKSSNHPYIIRYDKVSNQTLKKEFHQTIWNFCSADQFGIYGKNCTVMRKDEIKYFSHSREDVELFMNIEKYNL